MQGIQSLVLKSNHHHRDKMRCAASAPAKCVPWSARAASCAGSVFESCAQEEMRAAAVVASPRTWISDLQCTRTQNFRGVKTADDSLRKSVVGVL